MGKGEERKGSNCINTIILPNILTTLKNQLRKTKYAKSISEPKCLSVLNIDMFMLILPWYYLCTSK